MITNKWAQDEYMGQPSDDSVSEYMRGENSWRIVRHQLGVGSTFGLVGVNGEIRDTLCDFLYRGILNYFRDLYNK